MFTLRARSEDSKLPKKPDKVSMRSWVRSNLMYFCKMFDSNSCTFSKFTSRLKIQAKVEKKKQVNETEVEIYMKCNLFFIDNKTGFLCFKMRITGVLCCMYNKTV